MNEHDIAEQAYKNGYAAGVKDFAERLLKRSSIFHRGFGNSSWEAVTIYEIKIIAKEMEGAAK